MRAAVIFLHAAFYSCLHLLMFDQAQYERYASLQDAEQLAANNSCDDPHLKAADWPI